MGLEALLHHKSGAPRRALTDVNSGITFTDGEPKSRIRNAVNAWRARNMTAPYPRRRAIAAGVVLTLATGLGTGAKVLIERKNDCVPIGKPEVAAETGTKPDFLCTALNNGPRVLWTSDLNLHGRRN